MNKKLSLLRQIQDTELRRVQINYGFGLGFNLLQKSAQ